MSKKLLALVLSLSAFLFCSAQERRALIIAIDKYRVLIVDDIGYVKKTDSETQVLFDFIAHRYESGSLIITSNQPFSQWDQIFPDTMMTVAASYISSSNGLL